MRPLPLFLISTVVLGSAAVAAGPPQPAPAQVVTSLRTVLRSMATPPGQGMPPGQLNRPVDPDQGDDNASLVAITRVCSHDNPSATRSAICPTPISPE